MTETNSQVYSEPAYSSKQEFQKRTVLRMPWLHVLVYSVVNAIVLWMLLAFLHVMSLLSFTSMILFSGLVVVTILNTSFSIAQLLIIFFETTLAILLFFFAYRRYSISIPKTLIIATIITVAFCSLILPHYVTQREEVTSNPIQLGKQTLNLSEENTINSRASAKKTLAISDNSVIWVEHTKDAPPYPDNVWDLFLFTFDADSKSGETIRLTDTESNIHKAPNTAIIEGDVIYWTVDGNLYEYNTTTRKKDVIRKDTGGIYIVNKSIALVSGVTEKGVNKFGSYEMGLYLINLKTGKIIQDLSKYQTRYHTVTGTMGVDAYCPYDYDRDALTIVPITSSSQSLTITLPGTRSESSKDIVTCTSDLVVYTDVSGLHIYDIKSAKATTVDKTPWKAQAKLLNGVLYFSNRGNERLQRYDLKTGDTSEVSMAPENIWEKEQDEWDIDDDYIVYLEMTGEYDSDIKLRSLLDK